MAANDVNPALDATATDPAAARRRDAAAGDADDPLVGQQLAHFRIDAAIGRGGMGAVYRATDLSLDRQVAIKVLPDEVASDPDLRDRFYREARAQARIRHPNVCHIYYIGEDGGRLFFAMELVEGETVAARLAREGALPADDALEICLGIARGLRAAAAHGFAHRDVKPANAMIDKEGRVTVLDFGLVTHGRLATDGLPEGDVAHTIATIGTPLYMAPEQARGEAVDFRADVYSLGVTLHQLVAGEPPFSGASIAELASQHETSARPAIGARRKPPRSAPVVDELCDRMMAKSPADRFTSYDELIAVLERASERHAPPARALPRWFAGAIDFAAVSFAFGLMQAALSLAGLELDHDDLLLVALLAGYLVASWSRTGRTVGMAALRLELIPTASAGRPTLRMALRRLFSLWYPALLGAITIAVGNAIDDDVVAGAGVALVALAFIRVIAIGFWCGLRRARRRTPWDRFSGTEVVFQMR